MIPSTMADSIREWLSEAPNDPLRIAASTGATLDQIFLVAREAQHRFDLTGAPPDVKKRYLLANGGHLSKRDLVVATGYKASTVGLYIAEMRRKVGSAEHDRIRNEAKQQEADAIKLLAERKRRQAILSETMNAAEVERQLRRERLTERSIACRTGLSADRVHSVARRHDLGWDASKRREEDRCLIEAIRERAGKQSVRAIARELNVTWARVATTARRESIDLSAPRELDIPGFADALRDWAGRVPAVTISKETGVPLYRVYREAKKAGISLQMERDAEPVRKRGEAKSMWNITTKQMASVI